MGREREAPGVSGNPPWRGFNILTFFQRRDAYKTDEREFEWIAAWGFSFVRFPLSYRTWTKPEDPLAVDESVLDAVRSAVDTARKYRLHVCLNFHRAPGYCINRDEKEPFDLWKDEKALDAFLFHWRLFARMCADIPGNELSFNPVNEPNHAVDQASHEKVIRAFAAEVRQHDPDRLIVVDGRDVGTVPCEELSDLTVVHSTRFYKPACITHYKASWIPGGGNFPAPLWPGCVEDGVSYDRDALRRWYQPWAEMVRKGVPVHAGEGGVHNTVPHTIACAWLTDALDVLSEMGVGWALWNLCGSFGILDSGRSDVRYEDWHGRKLDRRMLEILRAH